MSRTQRLGLIAAAIAVVVVAFFVLRGGSDESDSPSKKVSNASGRIPTVVVGGDAKPKGGVQKLRFAKGGTIDFRVTSSVADEIHFHGYDVKKDVKAGGTVEFKVPAKDDGRFVVELESREQQIAEVEVTP